MDKIDFLVSVRCLTYNHAAYIRDTMDGFCMQQTYFPFVCVILDDASTDGEQEVIKNYLALHFEESGEGQIEETDDYSIFSWRLKPSYDFIQQLLTMNAHIEVLEPISLRNRIKSLLGEMLKKY